MPVIFPSVFRLFTALRLRFLVPYLSLPSFSFPQVLKSENKIPHEVPSPPFPCTPPLLRPLRFFCIDVLVLSVITSWRTTGTCFLYWYIPFYTLPDLIRLERSYFPSCGSLEPKALPSGTFGQSFFLVWFCPKYYIYAPTDFTVTLHRSMCYFCHFPPPATTSPIQLNFVIGLSESIY